MIIKSKGRFLSIFVLSGLIIVMGGVVIFLLYSLLTASDKSEIFKSMAIVVFMALLLSIIIYEFLSDWKAIKIDVTCEDVIVYYLLKGKKEVYGFKDIISCEVEAVSSFKGPVYKSLFLRTSEKRIEISDMWVTNLKELETFCFNQFLSEEEQRQQFKRSKEVDKEQRRSLLVFIVIIAGVLSYKLYVDDVGAFAVSIPFGVVLLWLIIKYFRMMAREKSL